MSLLALLSDIPHPRPEDRRLAAALFGGLLVMAVATVNLFAGLSATPGPIWDESYYATSTARYHLGRAQFAAHPPLGLMLIAAGDRLVGGDRAPGLGDVAAVKSLSGDDAPARYSWAGQRLAPAAFGVVGAGLFFLLMLQLSGQVAPALVFSNLYVFQTAFLAQFRAGQLDAFQIAFTLLALILFVRAVQREDRPAPLGDLSLGVACALAALIKLNALVLVLLGVGVVLRRLWLLRSEGPGPALLAAARGGGLMTLGFMATVLAVITLHFAIGSAPPQAATPAGRQDVAFVTGPYRDYLDGRTGLTPAAILSGIEAYRRFMAADFAGTPKADDNGSRPWSWPLAPRPITYRWDADGDRIAFVRIIANPVPWWTGALATAVAAGLLLSTRADSLASVRRRALLAILLTVWLAFLILHLQIAGARVVYSYHYFIGLVLTLAVVPLVWREAAERFSGLGRFGPALGGGLTALTLAGFLLYSPLALHRPLSRADCDIIGLLTPGGSCLR